MTRIAPLLLTLALTAGCLTADRSISYFARTTAANRVRIDPPEATGAVRSRHVVVAEVTGSDGEPLANARVEWLLDGSGHVLEVGDGQSNFGPKSQKIDGRYAVGYTAAKELRLRRHPDRDDDEIVIRPGQAYCVIESAIEGTTALTAYAPAVRDWDRQRVTVYRHWVDADWQFPPPATAGVGSPATLSTRLLRAADRQPLAGYRVRYRSLDGPKVSPAEATVSADADGRAVLTVTPAASAAGRTRWAVEIVRPDATGPGVVVARGETAVDWIAAQLALEMAVPPSVVVGQDVPVKLTARNTGGATTASLSVRLDLPDGTAFTRAEPPALAAGSQIVWQIPALDAGGQADLTAFVRATIAGPLTVRAEATADKLTTRAEAVSEAGSGQLVVKYTGPTTAEAGQPIEYEVRVTNPGTAAVRNVLLRAELDAGLQHESRSPTLEVPIEAVAPGETKSLPLTVTAKSSGKHGIRLTATAEGGQKSRADIVVDVRSAKLELELTGPKQTVLGQPGQWTMTLVNSGDQPAVNVLPRLSVPAELAVRDASDGGRVTGTDVTWPTVGLVPGERRTYVVTGSAARAGRGLMTGQVTADRAPVRRAEHGVEFIGVAQVRTELSDSDDPVEVGRTVVYTIKLTNAGTVPARGVGVTAEFPANLRPLHATGPAIGQVDGQKVTFAALPQLDTAKLTEYRLEATAVEPGDGRVRVSVSADGVAAVVVEESTRVVPARP